ncbi:hypothetical protein [Nocardiopsis sp. NRRL B-16309]|uniref:hypothetical protein n=1 Tax=Nocardiopsis sp. NRRL B-16309 TaxID=1519494 RepID=UPI0006AF7A6C|nr:hypothetical protein [Nocardiopsis sp. NRRL B-16309]KOX23610.1 hypothetical protein ADL05_02525 [Nocardiopsis sp. NRRL B-16309]
MEKRTQPAAANRNSPFSEARDAFLSSRGLVFTCEWRRFPWTFGADVEPALIGPSYLGHVAIGLKDGWRWGYQDRDGRWRYVQRDRLDVLVESVIEDRAGFTPPLPRRSQRRGGA